MDGYGKWSLPALAIRRPVTMCMLVILLVTLGLICWPRLPLEFTIKMDFPAMRVMIPYPGATPEQVENEVSIPAEGEFKTVPGLRRISSTSDSGGCYIWMEFTWDTDMKLASAEARDRIERLRLKLPPDVDKIILRRFSSLSIPIMRMAMFRAEREDELALYVRTHLRRQLMRLDGVADVEISGSPAESVYVEFNQNALLSLGLSINHVVQTLHAASINIGAGELQQGEMRYFVRLNEEFTDPAELEMAIITPSGIRLKDVAKVSLHGPSGADVFQIDGKRGVFVRVIKEPDANAVATCDAVHAELARLREDPEFRDVELFIFEDQSEIIRFALSSLYSAGKYGCAMAVIVLWLFLRRIRPTILVSLAIPASIVVAVIYIYFSGQTLNLVTLAALLISMGMLVDNTIVVIENIHRRQMIGGDPILNAQRGASEVGMAISASTLTTVVVFIPVFYLESGELSTIMREFAGPITTSLVTSLVIALTIIPLAESYGGRIGLAPSNARPNAAGKRFRLRMPHLGVMDFLWKSYDAVMAFSLQYRPLIIAVTLALLFASYHVPYQRTGFRGLPELDMRQFSIRLNVDQNYGDAAVRETVDMLVSRIENYRDELGITNVYVNAGSWGGVITLYLVKEEALPPGEALPCATEEARQFLADRLPARVPGARINYGVSEVRPEGGRSIGVLMRGDDTRTLHDIAGRFMDAMAALPELSEVKSDRPDEKEEIQLHIEKELASAAGVSPMLIARTVDFALRGANLPYMKRDGQEVAVRGQLPWTERGNVGDLETMAVQGSDGRLVPLMQLVSLRKDETPPRIDRVDAKSSLRLYGRVKNENLIQVRDSLRALIARFDLPGGYSIELDDELRNMDETLVNFSKTLVMSLILIYLVMAALFESWLLPLSVLTTVPMAFCGVYWVMFLTGKQMDTISLVGSIIMCGIIVNNGIVIIDHINQLRREGLDRTGAVLQGGHNRLRPVLMTTLTTVFCILPLAVGRGATGGAVTGLGRALVGGLCAGTFLTLFVVPIVYTIIDDLQAWTRDFFGSMAALGGAEQRTGRKDSLEL